MTSMQIIGEKINGTRKRVQTAIEERDADFIASLARRQADAGADWIDLNAGSLPDREIDDLRWLVEIVQGEVDRPLCLDSPNPAAIAAVLPAVRQTPMINSVTGEPGQRDAMLRVIGDSGASVVLLAIGAAGMPQTADDRIEVLSGLVGDARSAGIADTRLYLDPLLMTIATGTSSALMALDTIRRLRAAYPDVHITCGLSNISFGMPGRSLVNRTFLALALEAGLDTAIVDPLDRHLRAALYATDLILGRDRHCLAYTRAFRSGLLDTDPVAVAPA